MQIAKIQRPSLVKTNNVYEAKNKKKNFNFSISLHPNSCPEITSLSVFTHSKKKSAFWFVCICLEMKETKKREKQAFPL